MPILFSATDPRGYQVICSDELWANKVLVKHPIMKGLENEVKRAIEKPDYGFIYRDVFREDRDIYYRFLKKRNLYLKVVVEFNADHNGRIVTTFLASNPKGEKLIWPNSSL